MLVAIYLHAKVCRSSGCSFNNFLPALSTQSTIYPSPFADMSLSLIPARVSSGRLDGEREREREREREAGRPNIWRRPPSTLMDVGGDSTLGSVSPHECGWSGRRRKEGRNTCQYQTLDSIHSRPTLALDRMPEGKSSYKGVLEYA